MHILVPNDDFSGAQTWATLLQTLATAFAYPDAALYRALQERDFIALLGEKLARLPGGDELQQELGALQAGIASLVQQKSLRDLECDYISLFEVNHVSPPLHLYAGLYGDTGESRVQLLQRLHSVYRQCGLQIKQGEGFEQPDHLVVQLEFLAYLFMQYEQASKSQQSELLEQMDSTLRDFSHELAWIDSLYQTFVVQAKHPFYTPLLGFTTKLIVLLYSSL